MPKIVPQKFNPNKPAKIAQMQQDVADNLEIIFGEDSEKLVKAQGVCARAKVEIKISDDRLKLERDYLEPSADKT